MGFLMDYVFERYINAEKGKDNKMGLNEFEILVKEFELDQ